MILGNFFLLCEINPQDVYKWFMEVSVDAYPWVMCANVFGMSQFSDCGLIVTKPYICSSNYIKKMSNYKTGDWCKIVDSLFWRFVFKQREFFIKTPRLRVLLVNLEKKDQKEIKKEVTTADNFIESLI